MRLYLVGHRAPLVVALLCLSLLGAVVLGATKIPLPWLTSTAEPVVPFNFIFAMLILAAIAVFFSNNLSILEEHGTRQWRQFDVGFVLIVQVLLGVFAALGNPGIWQLSAVTLTIYFLLCAFQQPSNAFTATLFIMLLQCLLIVVLPAKFLPLFWEPSLVRSFVFTFTAVCMFLLVRSSLKLGEAAFVRRVQ